jgi:two-component system, chemotaxis family, CheB/CheR fusion protein
MVGDYHRHDNCNITAMTRVLLVEDSVDVLDILQIELEASGYEVDARTDGQAALLAAERARPDVIVSDLGMPGMDGLEFIRHVRKISGMRSVPAIALTGSSLDKDVEQALAFGFTAHLTKPVEVSDLICRIKQLTAKRLDRKAS